MFRNRTNSQKPDEELYATFKQNFPEVGPSTTTSSVGSAQSTLAPHDALLAAKMDHGQFGDHEELDQQETTPRPHNEAWRFTPSMLDTNSFAFNSFANQSSGYYTPGPGDVNTLYHHQAGDLHTPSAGLQLGTPLSLAMPEDRLQAGTMLDMNGIHLSMTHTHQLQNSAFASQQSYAPSSFVHRDSGYSGATDGNDGSPDHDMSMEAEHQMHLSSRQLGGTMGASHALFADKFRYHVTLNAPTAMIRHVDEIPVTYLNKGQAYSMTIVDTMPQGPSPGPVKYRTFVRISFEDEQQRQRPSACWQLWKEGRGLAEAHHRGGKLQAVEYVDPNQGGDEEHRRPRVELENASFDGFSVTWTPNPANPAPDCSVAVRFNFLSTDFSHSKGVKGIPVRLCAKTEIISSGTPETPHVSTPEVCYCKVKLFRDHGAERKLSNDVAHVKKTIDKLKQQITQIESGMKDFGKRKRHSIAGKATSSRPGKVQKHKRTWSVSSQGSSGRPAAEEDLHSKLATVQDMFTSTRPASVLYLRGLEQDDPDFFPVTLPEKAQDSGKTEAGSRKSSWEHRPSIDVSPNNFYQVSPSLSARSSPSQPPSTDKLTFKKPAAFDPSQEVPYDWTEFTHSSHADLTSPSKFVKTQSQPVKIQKPSTGDTFSDWIEAVGVDSSYQPPPERSTKPTACFYVLIKVAGKTPEDDYYRAVYLVQRTVKDLISSIASKCGVEHTRVRRTLRINPKGLKIMVDDEVVRELPEGQDMAVEFSEIEPEGHVKLEQGTEFEDSTKIMEMRLIF